MHHHFRECHLVLWIQYRHALLVVQLGQVDHLFLVYRQIQGCPVDLEGLVVQVGLVHHDFPAMQIVA